MTHSNFRLNTKQFLMGATMIPLLSALLLVGTASVAHAENWLTARLIALFGGDQVEGQAAGRGRGGAVRGETCNAFNQIRPNAPIQDHLIALVPKTNHGNTIARHPTFWFYLPIDQSSNAVRAEFGIIDENDESVLSEEVLWLSLPEQPGIFSVTLPSSEAPLEVNKQYRWYFIIVCDEYDYSINPAVQGSIRRVDGEAIAQQLGVAIDAAPENRLSIYTDHSIWYETVSLLLNSRDVQPELWNGLLSLYSLEDVGQELQIAPMSTLD